MHLHFSCNVKKACLPSCGIMPCPVFKSGLISIVPWSHNMAFYQWQLPNVLSNKSTPNTINIFILSWMIYQSEVCELISWTMWASRRNTTCAIPNSPLQFFNVYSRSREIFNGIICFVYIFNLRRRRFYEKENGYLTCCQKSSLTPITEFREG